jgi:hypothetical protein
MFLDLQNSFSKFDKTILKQMYSNFGKTYNSSKQLTDGSNLDISSLEYDKANCEDMSAVVQVFSNAMGVDHMGILRIEGDGQSITYSSSIRLIGGVNPSTREWGVHQVALYKDKVFDACIMLGSTVPVDMTRTDYENAVRVSGGWKEYDDEPNYGVEK